MNRAAHPFDQAVGLQAHDGTLQRGHIPPSHANMVGPFGGTIAAVLLNAVLQHPARQGEPLSLTVNFTAPIADAPFDIDAQPVRTNKSTQHWSVALRQQDEVAATATAVLAHRRDTWADTEATPPDAPEPDAVPLLSAPGFPPWTRNYALRIVRGSVAPGATEGPDSESLLWVRDEPPRPLDWLSLTAICDVFFPRVFVRRQKLAPASTVSLTIYFLSDAPQLAQQGDGALLAVARANRFHRGYADQSAHLWSRDRSTLLAVTHQVVYFRD